MPIKSADVFYKSESRYRMLVENSCDIIFSLDTEGNFTFVSHALKKVLGYNLAEVLGHNFCEFVHSEDRPLFESSIMASIRTNSAQEVTCRIHHFDGSWRWLSLRGTLHLDEDEVLTIIGVAQDVTERLRIEEIMAQTERMSMISSMAAGMAHEINNPLGAILQHAQNIERRVSIDIPANQKAAAEVGVSLDLVRVYLQKRGIFGFIDHIRSAGMRASDIISNMLQFSRRGETGLEPVDIALLLDRVWGLAGTDYEMKKRYEFSRIDLKREYAADLPLVQVVVVELEQVLLNILKNAAQAIAAEALPRLPLIILRTRLSKGMVLIEIEDNGPGMDEATRLRVFEPFFSTKEVGVGTGLGLSVAYDLIAKGHQGTIEVRSRPGKGSCFTVKLPLQRGA
jgi:PAS domain S-box-containing protein